MNKKEILAKVRDIVAEQVTIKASDIGEKSLLKDDLGLDSLEVVELFESLQEQFSVVISDEEAQDLDTIGKVIDLLVAKLG